MSARDDYPQLARAWGTDIARALDEIDNLRRWKDEAMQVLAEWQQCYDTLAESGHPAPLGMSMARHVAGYLKVTA
jgi:hypothetical protein